MDKRFKRVLVKLSGEALIASDGFWLDHTTLARLAKDLADCAADGFEIAVVIGAGNIIRGAKVASSGRIDRPTADSMGMLATVINSLALESAIEAVGAPARTMSAVAMPSLCETYARQPALHHLTKKRIVVLAGGTGNPFFTTDTAAVLRAAELACEAVFKVTQVDGVYSSDPKKHDDAVRYERLTHDEAIMKDLKVLDTAAFALARDSGMPIIVGSAHAPSSIGGILRGEALSTLVAP